MLLDLYVLRKNFEELLTLNAEPGTAPPPRYAYFRILPFGPPPAHSPAFLRPTLPSHSLSSFSIVSSFLLFPLLPPLSLLPPPLLWTSTYQSINAPNNQSLTNSLPAENQSIND